MSTRSHYETRLERARAALDKWDVDGLLISSPTNRRWLSGFTGSLGWLLLTREEAWLATDFRYWEQAQTQAPDFKLFRLTRDAWLPAFFGEAARGTIALESDHVTLAEYKELQKIAGIEWHLLQESLEKWRAVKTAAELETIKAAAAITDQVMAAVPLLARPGQPERELAWKLEKQMREAGAEAMAFEVTVASGPNSALPHHKPGERVLQPGDMLIVDMGAQLQGYKSDLTRSFYLGKEPPARFWDVYNLVLDAQKAALTGLQAGITCWDGDALSREVIGAAGHAEHFGHGLGHGVGLDIHEAPHLSRKATKDETLAAGMVTTVEPGVYLPGWGGVRIEDLVLITEAGVELLSHCPKEPVIALNNT